MKNKSFVVYFKPGCSKCNTLLKEMDSGNQKCDLVDYLNDFPSREMLEEIIKKSGRPVRDFIRTSEPVYSTKYAGKKFSDKKWVDVLMKNHILLQRPIVVKGDKVWIARDAETIGEILG
ncbi:MAG: hypothetical protein KG003_02090 [Bacteroidetes bacterium]|nr:hypothetical protein [Bacteroidota bacterium]